MKIGIINYGAGNLRSVQNALEKLNQKYLIISKPSQLIGVGKAILPGVGSAGSAMKKLKSSGLANAIKNFKKPFLGICLGLQLLTDFSEEGGVKCLSLVNGKVKKFRTKNLKIPRIGWNKINIVKKSKLLNGVESGDYFYFANSYYLDAPAEYTLAVADYGVRFSSVIQKKNYYAVQFHPEKSGEKGLKLLFNFCEKC